MLAWLAAWWRDYREGLRSPGGHCAVCRENLAPLGGGIEVSNLERVCSDECFREHESHSTW